MSDADNLANRIGATSEPGYTPGYTPELHSRTTHTLSSAIIPNTDQNEGAQTSSPSYEGQSEIRGLGGLFTAIEIDDPAAVFRIVVDEEVGLEGRSKETQCTPLYTAATAGSVRLVELLCRLGADVNSKSKSEGDTPLHIASAKGFVRVVEILLDNGADVTIKNLNNQTALSLASTQEVGAYLTWWQCESDPSSSEAAPSFLDSYRTWAVERAVSAVNTSLATGLATLPESTQGEIRSRVSSIDMNMLSFAGARAYVAARPRLWLLGAPDDYEDDLYAGSGAEVSTSASSGTVQQIVDAGCAGTTSNPDHLPGAPNSVHPSISKVPEESTTDNGSKMGKKENPALHDQICKVAMLLGCAPSKLLSSSTVRSDGSTAAHLAANIDAEQVLEQLFASDDARVKVNTKRADGQTPLHAAAYRGNAHCCAILLLHGASLNTRDNDSRTALHLASSRGHVQIVAVLLRHGADPNAQDANGNTCAHVAAVNGHVRVLGVLGDEGAEMNAVNTQGKTPLDCAAALSQQSVVDLLQQTYGGLRGKEVRARLGDGESGVILRAWDNMTDAAYDRLVPDSVKSVYELSETMSRLKGTKDARGRARAKPRSLKDPSEIERRRERVAQIFASTSGVFAMVMAVAVSVATVGVSMTGISVIGVSLVGGADTETLIYLTAVCVVLGAPVVTYLLFKLYTMLKDEEHSGSVQPGNDLVLSSDKGKKKVQHNVSNHARTPPRSPNKD